MRPVPGLLALLLFGCVELRFYDAEIWVDVLYPPDSSWSLSPVGVVVGGAIQETSQVVRILPLLFRTSDPEPGYRPVRLSLWVDGEKRMEVPDTALTHRIRLPLSEGWHTLQVRAGTTESRIRHVRVLAPEHFPIRFERQTSPVYPQTVLLYPLQDTVLAVSLIQIHIFYDPEQKQWVAAHPRETLRVRAPFTLYVRAYPQGLYAVAHRGDSGRAFWVHANGITAIWIPRGISPFDRYDEQVCARSSALVLHPLKNPRMYFVLYLRQNGVQGKTMFSESGDAVFFTCQDGEVGMIKMDVEEYRKIFPNRWSSLPFHALLVVEDGDTVFRTVDALWWRDKGKWYHLAFPEVPRYRISCRPGGKIKVFPEIFISPAVPFHCDVGKGGAYLDPWHVRAEEGWYIWRLQKEERP